MELSYAIVVVGILAALMLAASMAGLLRTKRGPSDLCEFVCDVCSLAANPNSTLVKAYRLPSVRISDGAVEMLEPCWVFPPCGRQEGSTLYLPVEVEHPLELEGLVVLNLTSTGSAVRVESIPQG